MICRIEPELKWRPAVGEDWDGGSQVPAGEGTGASLNVVLCVVGLAVHTDADGEQLQQFTAVVLIDCRLVAFDVVQVVEHGGVG